MKRKAIKITSAVLSAAIIFGIGTSVVSAKTWEPQTPAEEKQNAPVSSPAASSAKSAASKDETVYVFSSADGKQNQVLVSDWLKNPGKDVTLTDVSSLKDIENVKGSEEFAAGKDHALTWQADGHDIYYQGTSSQKIPVDMKITYTLDGKKISPEKLAGKSGRVTIRFDYQNNETVSVKVNDKNEKIHVPFIMVTGTMLDPEVFRNVTVVNGQLENMGNEIAVLGIALPGMQDNLAVSKDKLSIPDYVEIQADVENFDMGPTMTLATTELLSRLDSEGLDVQELKDQAQKLTEGMSQLMDGAGKLSDGLATLLDQTQVMVEGVNQLSGGAINLQAGADALAGGASQLQAGASQLSAGLSTLDSNSAALTDGAEQVFNTLLSSATAQLNASGVSVPELTIGNYAEVLNGVIASLDENAVYQSALQQVTAGVEAKRGEIEAAVTEAVRQQVNVQVTSQVTAVFRQKITEAVQASEGDIRTLVLQEALGMSPEEYEAAVAGNRITEEQQAGVEAAVAAAMEAEISGRMESENIKAQIAAAVDQTTAAQMATEEIQGKIAENIEIQVEKAISDTMASPEVQGQLQAAAAGAQAVIALKTSLDSYNGFYLGVLSYTSGVSSAAAGAADLIAGADTLKEGMDSLDAGASALNSGIQTVNGKMPDLVAGITALKDGSVTLKDGLTKLMDEGIQKIADLAEEDLTDLTARLAACIDVAGGYNSFSGLAPNTEGSVKFIYKTDSISAEN